MPIVYSLYCLLFAIVVLPKDGGKRFIPIMVDTRYVFAEFVSLSSLPLNAPLISRTTPTLNVDGASGLMARAQVRPRSRTRLEVVIPLRRNRPAYQATGISLGDDAEVEEGAHAVQSSENEVTVSISLLLQQN